MIVGVWAAAHIQVFFTLKGGFDLIFAVAFEVADPLLHSCIVGDWSIPSEFCHRYLAFG